MGSKLCRNDIAFFVLLALLTVLGFQFGVGNQTEQFPLVLRLLDPGFIEQDFYTNTASGFGPRYYYVHFLAFLASYWSLPAVVLALTLIVNFSLAGISYLAARDLLRADRLAGQIAAVLAVASSSFSLGLAPYIRFESFQPASLAIPISLVSLWCGLRRRPIEAAVLAGLASAFHPLIGLEVGALALGCVGACLVLERWGSRPPSVGRRGVGAWLAGVLVLAAAAYVIWIAPMADGTGPRLSSEEFYELLAAFRAPHHYLPSAMPTRHYLAFGAYLLSLLGIWWYWRMDALRRASTDNRGRLLAALIIMLPVLVIVLVCSLSYVFVELIHSKAWIVAQPFRLLYIVKWIGFLFVGWLSSRLFRSADPVDKGFAVLMLLGTAEAQPVILLSCLAAKLFLVRARSYLPSYAGWFVLGGLALAGGIFGWRFGSSLDTIRITAGLICVAFLARDHVALSKAVVVPGLVVVGLVLLAVSNASHQWIALKPFNPTFTWEDLSGHDVDVARWARDATPDGSIWLVPPEFEAFRIIAERAVVVDFTSIPFADSAMREWRQRMTTSYGEVEGAGFVALDRMRRNYLELTPDRAAEVSERFGATHAVLYQETKWVGPVLYGNEEFKVVKLRGQG